MSKELEALELLREKAKIHSSEYSFTKGKSYEELESENDEAYNLIKQALRTPTADEVCEALSEYLQVVIRYDNYEFYEYNHDEKTGHAMWMQGRKEMVCDTSLPPHLINLISRFYMGVE